MKPYGLIRKILHNFEDVHPPKGHVNWWEHPMDMRIRKKSERQQSKKQIQKEINESC